MKIPDYQVGDLIILKPNCWKHMPKHENSVGLITELLFHSQTDENLKSFLVNFESLKHILGEGRIVWHTDVLKHYPVVK
jgi:hypothetical protein